MLANSGDHGQTSSSVASHLNVHCLSISHLWDTRQIWVKFSDKHLDGSLSMYCVIFMTFTGNVSAFVPFPHLIFNFTVAVRLIFPVAPSVSLISFRADN